MALPVAYIVLAATLFDIPLSNCARILLSPFYYITVFLGVLTGYGLWEMKRWSWYCFVVTQILVAYSNASYVFNYSESHHKTFGLLIAIILQIILVLRVDREVRVPYLFPRIRWWESNPRLRLSCPVILTRKSGEMIEGEILDISLAGCFIKLRQDLLPDESIYLKFKIFGFDIECEGIAVWLAQSAVTHPKGVGFKFGFLPKGQKRNLRNVQKRIRKISNFYRRARYWMTQDEFMSQLEALEKNHPITNKN